MCISEILGILMFVLPFVFIFIYIWKEDDLQTACIVFGIPVALGLWVAVALYIIKYPFWCF